MKEAISYDYGPVPTIREFSRSDRLIRGLLGPFGCLGAEVRVVTEMGPIPISRIDRPMRVLSWDAKQGRFRLSWCGGSFPKGRAKLVRVVTPSGEFAAAAHHRMLCADGSYRRVCDLGVGAILYGSHGDPLWTLDEVSRLSSGEGGRRWSERVADWMGRYADTARQYGQRFLTAEGNGLAFAQGRVGVQRSVCRPDEAVDGHRGDLRGLKRSHSHPDLCAVLTYIDDCLDRTLRRLNNVALRNGVEFCRSTTGFHQGSWRSPLRDARPTAKEWLECARSLTSPERTIVSLETEEVEREYWDLQVLDTHNYVTEDGAIHHNSGKSSGCVVEILRRAMAQKPGADGVRRTRWACIRNSYPQLRDTTIKTFKDWVDFDVMGVWRERDHTFTMKFGDVEAEVMFRALDRPDDTSNLLSLELTGAWLNEAREIDWAIVQALLGRVGRFPATKDGGCTWFGIIADTNPPDADSWWYRLFEKEKPESAAIFKQPSGVSERAENTNNLPAGYYQNLLSLNSEDWCKVHVHGEYGFVQDGKPVFPMYADGVHCTEKADYVPGLKVYRGWDFGLTPAISLSHLTAEGRWIIFDELVAEDVGIDRFADRVVRTLEERYPGARYVDVGDPAGQQRAQTDERSCFDLLYAKGIKISGGEQSLVIRIESIRKALNSMIDGKPQFALNPRCEVLRKGMLGKYRYRKLQTGADRFSEEPEKNAYSHVMDSLQYVATRLFGGALRTMVQEKKPDRYGRSRLVSDGGWMSA